jgi:hypothetical protein
MQRKRIAVTLIVIITIVLLGAAVKMAGPALMNTIITLHSR